MSVGQFQGNSKYFTPTVYHHLNKYGVHLLLSTANYIVRARENVFPGGRFLIGKLMSYLSIT